MPDSHRNHWAHSFGTATFSLCQPGHMLHRSSLDPSLAFSYSFLFNSHCFLLRWEDVRVSSVLSTSYSRPSEVGKSQIMLAAGISMEQTSPSPLVAKGQVFKKDVGPGNVQRDRDVRCATSQMQSSTSDSTQDPTSRPKSYVQYLAQLEEINRSFYWIHRFFKHHPEKPEGRVTVLDINAQGTIQMANGAVATNRDLLENQPPHISMRIVLLSYKDMWSLDRDLLDSVCYAFDLDPVELWAHFDSDCSHLRDPYRDTRKSHRKTRTPRPLLSFNAYLKVTFCQYERNQLLVALLNAVEGKPRTGTLNMSSQPIHSAHSLRRSPFSVSFCLMSLFYFE